MESESDWVEVHAVVKGRVQGVGFRATTRHHARKLGLVGSVKNLPDGTVDVWVQGPEASIERLWDRLREDSGLGRVEEIQGERSPPKRTFDGFHILF